MWSGSYFIYMLPGMVLVILAQLWVSSTYRKWGRVRNTRDVTGIEAAQRLLSYGSLSGITVEAVDQRLGDHYDPRSQKLRLSPGVAQSRSVASLAIAAHEIGHASQHAQAYLPLQFRSALVPVVNFGSSMGWILIIVGLLLRIPQVGWLGVGAFSLGVLFSLATLPVELNASSRAMKLLDNSGLIRSGEERRGVRAMLNAAAFTYVAALATAVLQLLYYVGLVGGLGGRRRR